MTKKYEINNVNEQTNINYSLNDIFTIDETKDNNELNINQIGLNENNPYDSL